MRWSREYEQHRAVPAGEDEAVAVWPSRDWRVVAQVVRPEGIGHRGGAHRQAGVAGVGLLHAIRRDRKRMVLMARARASVGFCPW